MTSFFECQTQEPSPEGGETIKSLPGGGMTRAGRRATPLRRSLFVHSFGFKDFQSGHYYGANSRKSFAQPRA